MDNSTAAALKLPSLAADSNVLSAGKETCMISSLSCSRQGNDFGKADNCNAAQALAHADVLLLSPSLGSMLSLLVVLLERCRLEGRVVPSLCFFLCLCLFVLFFRDDFDDVDVLDVPGEGALELCRFASCTSLERFPYNFERCSRVDCFKIGRTIPMAVR